MSEDQNSPGLVSWLLLILLALIWGSSFILIKKSLLTFSAGEVGTLRMFIAFIGLSPFAIPVLKKIDSKKLPTLFLVGFVGSLLPAILFAIAQTQLESAITGVINAMTPVFVLLIGLVFFHHKIKTVNAIGIAIGFMGCSFIMLGGAYFDLSGVNLYALFVIAATIMYGISVNLIKHFLTDIRSIHITAISFTLVSPISLGYLLIATDFLDKVGTDPQFLSGLAYVSTLALIGTAMALVIFNKLVKTASPIFASSVTYVIPIVAIGWGLIDGELLNVYQIVGIGIVLVGVYLANKK
ncbi:MAG: DMT family transporter [Reichenbachiella sp.]|uniref:DMT family transporter n=1 Tax=Reichenbachiella sp. TaxID=2184521 RepID=UPI003296C075